MNQFESDALRLAIGLFIVFCITFSFLRHKLGFWISLPMIVMVTCLGWFGSALLVMVTFRTSWLQGPVFMFTYFAAVLMTPPLLAAGMFEVVLGTYASFMSGDRTKSFPARPHFVAALSTFACVGAYCVVGAILR